jgi:glycosyltransferase involved in cell wall biosynthesis
MKTTCLINNYNYKDFICEAIESALSQTHKFDEIIVVDDASTDGSINLLQEKYGPNPSVKIIIKEKNEGQLSAFNEGFLNSIGDIIFFLDSDDFYSSQYLEVALSTYKHKPMCSFLYCSMGLFNDKKQNYQPPSHEQMTETINYVKDCGYSVILTLSEQIFIGSPTSGISIRREHLSKILPIPYLSDWRTRADDCIVFGSSIVGAHKFFLNLPLVAYRLHDKNSFLNTSSMKDRFKFFRRQIAYNRLITFLCQRMNYSISELWRNAPYEFKTIDCPTWEFFFIYLRIMMKSPYSVPLVPQGVLNKFYGFSIMLKHMIAQGNHSSS